MVVVLADVLEDAAQSGSGQTPMHPRAHGAVAELLHAWLLFMLVLLVVVVSLALSCLSRLVCLCPCHVGLYALRGPPAHPRTFRLRFVSFCLVRCCFLRLLACPHLARPRFARFRCPRPRLFCFCFWLCLLFACPRPRLRLCLCLVRSVCPSLANLACLGLACLISPRLGYLVSLIPRSPVLPMSSLKASRITMMVPIVRC